MASERVSVPVKIVNGAKWGQLSALADSHEICAEKVIRVDEQYSFAGGHRVRLLRLRKNVHWKIPDGVVVDIKDVAPAAAPPARRH